MRSFWTKKETNLLIKLYEIDGLSASELYPIFNENYHRSQGSISSKINKLKIKHTKGQTSQIKSRLFTGKNNGMYGKKSPLKGLTIKTSIIIKEKSKKLSKTRKDMFKSGLLNTTGKNNGMYGKEAWNKGKNKYNDKRIFNYGLKISKNKKKWWKNLAESEKQNIINRLNRAMIQNNKITKIEVIIGNFLTNNNIRFIRNKQISRFFIDFFLPEYNLAIECDGDYWHSNPMFYGDNLSETQIKNKERDKRKEILLKEKSIKFLRFWEHDIKYNFQLIKDQIWEQLQKK